MNTPSRRSPWLAGAATAGLALSLSFCSTNTPFDPIIACADSQLVTVGVSAGTSPRITWTPTCGMAELIVDTDTSPGPLASRTTAPPLHHSTRDTPLRSGAASTLAVARPGCPAYVGTETLPAAVRA